MIKTVFIEGIAAAMIASLVNGWDKFFAYLVLWVIIALVLFAIYSEVAQTEREIAEEEAQEKYERRYRQDIEDWKKTALHPRVHIKVLDGEEFTLRRR